MSELILFKIHFLVTEPKLLFVLGIRKMGDGSNDKVVGHISTSGLQLSPRNIHRQCIMSKLTIRYDKGV